jgi:hypothetical protein
VHNNVVRSANPTMSHFEEQHVNQDVARFAVKCGMWVGLSLTPGVVTHSLPRLVA